MKLIYIIKKNRLTITNEPIKKNGNYLLFHTGLPCSTIGATKLNFRVRDGIGWILCAIVTVKIMLNIMNASKNIVYCKINKTKRSQASRLLSIARLNTLLHLHLRPINPIFYWES